MLRNMLRTPKFSSLMLALVLLWGCRATGQPLTDGSPVAPIDSSAMVSEPTAGVVKGFDCTDVEGVATNECQALVALFEGTGGPEWSDHSGWLETSTPCNWSGVSCVDGHLDMLNLMYNNLRGQLPVELASLERLRVLDLHNNALAGGIPDELGALSTLEALDLSGNELSGEIPAALGNLPALQMLNLAHNQLGGAMPAGVGHLTALRTLDLAHNGLVGEIPAALSELSALETLRLNDNQLEGTIPFELGELSSLTEVDLSFNELTGTAPAALQDVAIHHLWGNKLDGTIFITEDGGQIVNFLGAAFTVDRSVTDSVWVELVPETTANSGPGMPWSPSEHIVFTLVREAGPQNHAPMGLYVPAEAQIHVYAIEGLNSEVQPTVDSLKQLLAEQPDPDIFEDVEPPQMETTQPGIGMLPPSNARETLRAQLQFLSFVDGRGVRYLTQLSQGPVPVNNQELFYTFQGISADGESYVAAYFPLTLPALPDSDQVGEDTLVQMVENWEAYLTETGELLNNAPASSFAPDLAALDALIRSLSVSGTTPIAEVEGVWPDDGESVDGEPVLQWAALPGADHYQVVVVDDDAYPPVVVLEQMTEETTLPVQPGLEGGSYSWTVRAVDVNGKIVGELTSRFLIAGTQ